MTNKLYETDSYIRTFEAAVLSCDIIVDAYVVTLDQTAFYPEGGGQTYDTGTLGGAPVLAVYERDGLIYHTTKTPLPIGARVHGEIDWPRRFALMQNHSGEHILSGIVHTMHGYDNVGFHMGSEAITIDFNGELTDSELTKAERLANEAVYANLPIQTQFPVAEALADMHYRSKKALHGQVRIVSVPGVDDCACCGTHVRQTGEIGLIKILSARKHKGGTRLEMLCGVDALSDYIQKHRDILAISRLLSAKPNETPQAVQALLDAEHQLSRQLMDLRGQIITFLAANTNVQNEVACVFSDSLAVDDARKLGTLLAARCQTAYVFCGADDAGYRYCLIAPEAKAAAERLHERFGGRGGGKSVMAQGQLAGSRADIEAFVYAE